MAIETLDFGYIRGWQGRKRRPTSIRHGGVRKRDAETPADGTLEMRPGELLDPTPCLSPCKDLSEKGLRIEPVLSWGPCTLLLADCFS